MDMLDLIIYAAVTVFLLSRLWSVLGQRDEDEDRPSPRQNPFASPENPNPDEEDVMVLEGRARAVAPSPLMTATHAPASLAGALDRIRQVEPSFDEKKFLDGARLAFAKIVAAFAQGDLSGVTRFLGSAVRVPFEKAIDQRKQKNQTLENRIEKLLAADIVGAQLDEGTATLQVEFVSHQINLLRDAEGQLVDGVPGQAEEVRDLWVFQRDIRSSDPNWQLIETRA